MIKRVLAAIVIILIIAIGVVVYLFLKTPEEASGPIEAIPITAEADQASTAEAGGDTAVENTPVASEAQVDAEAAADAAAEPEVRAEAETSTDTDPSAETEASTEAEAQAEVTPETVATVGEAEAPSQDSATGMATEASPVTFEVVPAESVARFYIDEVLRGSPTTVVGATDQVAGQLSVNASDLSSAQVGVIRVNARTLATNNDFRNRAIKNQILRTNDYEFVVFSPTDVIGLPESGAVGETYTFQIVGDLTVTDVTRPVTFDVTATATSNTRIEGVATTAFLYTDFELFIPDSPSVDTVNDEVRLELEFVAEAVL